MPRGKNKIKPRVLAPDPVYNSELVHYLINMVMGQGKKNVARKIVYEALAMLEKRAGSQEKALELFNQAYEQIVPLVEVRSRRVGGSVYQIPREVNPQRKRALAIRWLLSGAKNRSQKTMGARLGAELLDAVEGRGGAMKKRLDIHKMAEANRAFSHYAW
jgi:small subunit ribosomal protein S7